MSLAVGATDPGFRNTLYLPTDFAAPQTASMVLFDRQNRLIFTAETVHVDELATADLEDEPFAPRREYSYVPRPRAWEMRVTLLPDRNGEYFRRLIPS